MARGMAPAPKTPGEVLRLARERSGRSQQEVADALGVSQPTVHSWESDEKRPRADRLAEVAAAYGVDVRRIIPEAAA